MFNPETKEELFVKAPRFERAFRILMQRNLSVTQNRLFDTISKVLQIIFRILERYPTLLIVSLSIIASTLVYRQSFK
jgi:hypothetical protein